MIRDVDYYRLLDVDKVVALIEAGHNTFSKVNVGIYHYFSPTLKGYVRKVKRKANNWKLPRKFKLSYIGLAYFVLSTITVYPLLFYVLKGNSKKRDLAWFMHIPVCWITLVVYVGKSLLDMGHKYHES